MSIEGNDELLRAASNARRAVGELCRIRRKYNLPVSRKLADCKDFMERIHHWHKEQVNEGRTDLPADHSDGSDQD